MAYAIDYVKAALPLVLFDGMTVQTERVEGMPGGTVDPRKAMDPQVMMIDIRRAWDHCDWLSYDQRHAMLAIAMFGTRDLASQMTGVPGQTLELRQQTGLLAMTDWMNSTYLDREEWERLAEEAKSDYYSYGSIA